MSSKHFTFCAFVSCLQPTTTSTMTTSTTTTTTTITSMTTTTVAGSSPRIKVIIPGSTKVTNVTITPSEDEKKQSFHVFLRTFGQVISKTMKPQQTLELVNITDMTNSQGLDGNRGLRGNPIGNHHILGTLTIAYEIILEEICDSGDCKNKHEISNALYDQVTGVVKDETESGDFARSLQANAVEENAIFLFQATIGSSDFGRFAVISYIPILFPY